jgi:chitin disaccharide deacetylase
MTMITRYLIVNADDCGLSAGINQGILEGHQRGIVTSTTVMVNLPDAADGIRLLQREAPNIGIGLHFNITHGKPLAEHVSSLTRADGTFYGVQEFYSGGIDRFDPDEIRREHQAQFERFVALAGTLPDHMDSHHGTTYKHPAAFEIMLKLAAEHNIPLRSGQEALKNQSIATVYAAHPAPRWPDNTYGGFFGDTATVETLLRDLPSLPDGVSEMICHPGYAHDVNEAYKEPRERELQALTDPQVREMLRRENIELVSFNHLSKD